MTRCSAWMAVSLNFNEFVRLQMDPLEARKDHSNDVKVNLSNGYLATPDNECNQYIKQKKNDYEEGQDLTADDIVRRRQIQGT